MANKPRTLANFKEAHDESVIIPNRIRAALDKLLTIGPEHYEYEQEFIKMAGVSNGQLAAYRSMFAKHIVETSGARGNNMKRVYFGSPKAAEKVRPK